jgi:hypothetical protein
LSGEIAGRPQPNEPTWQRKGQAGNLVFRKNEGDGMEAVKIIKPTIERKPCVCGAMLYVSRAIADKRNADIWLCSRHCGARGLTYQGALRRKVRLDLLSWGDLRRSAQTLIADDHEDDYENLPLQ